MKLEHSYSVGNIVNSFRFEVYKLLEVLLTTFRLIKSNGKTITASVFICGLNIIGIYFSGSIPTGLTLFF